MQKQEEIEVRGKAKLCYVSATGSQHTSFSKMVEKNIKSIVALDTSDIWLTESGASRHITHRSD